MNYIKHLKECAARRQKILTFLATGKSMGQAGIRFNVSRQRIQQIAADEARRNNGK